MNFLINPRRYNDRITSDQLSDNELLQYTRFDRPGFDYLKTLLENKLQYIALLIGHAQLRQIRSY